MKEGKKEDKDGIFMRREREKGGWRKGMKRGCLCEEDKAQKAHAPKNRARNMVV